MFETLYERSTEQLVLVESLVLNLLSIEVLIKFIIETFQKKLFLKRSTNQAICCSFHRVSFTYPSTSTNSAEMQYFIVPSTGKIYLSGFPNVAVLKRPTKEAVSLVLKVGL